MTESELIEEIKKLNLEEAQHQKIIDNRKFGEDVDYSRARLDFIKNRKKFLKDKIDALRLQRGIFRTR